ncbi:MAG: H-type lectin domain-containing protein [Pseudomonadota bacterium]
MKRLRNHLIGIDQGEEVLFSDFENGGQMWSGTGQRASTTSVRFSEPFKTLPSIHITMSMWDIDHGSNPRMDIKAEAITPDGFNIVFRTWGDSRVARVRAGWMAIGELGHGDEWELY